MRRRDLLTSMALLATTHGPAWARTSPASADTPVRLGATWRGPQEGDLYQAGVLEARWGEPALRWHYRLTLPSRAHGLSAQADGGLLIVAARPGSWLWRCDGQGRVVQQADLRTEPGAGRLNGHAETTPDGSVIYTTETDARSGRGRIGVRDGHTLRKLDEWDSHGLEPHQLLLDHEGHLIVAHGGIPRTADDRKVDLHRMESSLVRLDGRSGKLLGHWRLADRRLSLRHIAWADEPPSGAKWLGIAMQAEHETAQERARAPVLAVFDGQQLMVPTPQNDGVGYAGDIAAACGGGFVLSSHQPGRVHLWHPSRPEQFSAVVEFRQAYALTRWAGPTDLAGALVATAAGLVRWHPTLPGQFLAWPEPMAPDNHWVIMGEA